LPHAVGLFDNSTCEILTPEKVERSARDSFPRGAASTSTSGRWRALDIAMVKVWNRLNVTTRQVAGEMKWG
jgi:hypothetical protein